MMNSGYECEQDQTQVIAGNIFFFPFLSPQVSRESLLLCTSIWTAGGTWKKYLTKYHQWGDASEYRTPHHLHSICSCPLSHYQWILDVFFRPQLVDSSSRSTMGGHNSVCWVRSLFRSALPSRIQITNSCWRENVRLQPWQQWSETRVGLTLNLMFHHLAQLPSRFCQSNIKNKTQPNPCPRPLLSPCIWNGRISALVWALTHVGCKIHFACWAISHS